jgi:uncharacterized protein
MATQERTLVSERDRKGLPRVVLMLAMFTLLVLGGAGAWLIVFVQDRSFLDAVLGARAWWWHTLLGGIAGWLIAEVAWSVIKHPWLHPVRVKYTDMIGPLMPTLALQVLVSVCAGVGEELLFRGAVQYWLGIPLTAVVFVALHGYLHPLDWRVSIYGAFMVLAMIGLGTIAQRAGLLAPMIAHTVIDIVLIGRLVRDWKMRESAA